MCALNIKNCIDRASQWLEEVQNKQDGGWGQYQGSDSNSLNTAESILALIETDCHRAGDVVIQNGVGYLIGQQLTKNNHNIPDDYGCWPRIVATDNVYTHMPDTVRTCLALLALNATGKPINDETLSLGVQWLAKAKNGDGGWGYKYKSESRLFPTCLALKALITIYYAGNNQLHQIINEGLRHLSSYRNKDGSFGKEYALVASHTLCVIDTLRLLKSHDFPNYENERKQAMEWIQLDPNRVISWGNETIVIGDSPDSPHNYTYSHINPTIYLAIVGQFTSEKNIYTKEALLVTSDNMDFSTRGFCAKRSVSWATANTMIGLTSVKAKFENFPVRESTATRPGGKQILLGLLLLFIVISGILAFTEKLSITYTSFSFIIILAALLIYGFISEKTFLELTRSNKEITEKVAKQKDDKG